jgi:signal transduction histidine kinase/DNA-binding response OmpR family regulator
MNRLLQLLLAGWFFPCIVLAQGKENPVCLVDSNRQIHNLTACASLLVDSSNVITAEQLAIGGFNQQFRPLATYRGTYQKKVNYWLRIPVVASTPIQNWWLQMKPLTALSVYYAQWEYMDVYSVDTVGRVRRVGLGGLFTPQSQKSVQEVAGLTAVSLTLAANNRQTLLIRLRNDFYEGVWSTPELRDPVVGIPANIITQTEFALGSVAVVLSLFSFFFLIFVREKAYLYFGIYLLLLSFHYLIIDPSIPFINYFIPEHPQLVFYCFHLLTTGGILFFLLFGRAFINLSLFSARIDQYLSWLIRLWGAVVVLELILMNIYRQPILFPWAIGVLLVFLVGLLVRIAFFNSVLARFYVAGALWLFVFSVMGYLWEQGLINPGFVPWPVAQLGQMLIYLLGLAYKIRLSETARAEAERIREIDAIKSRFFANISHEFRTPLTLIQGPLNQLETEIGSGGTGLPNRLTRHLKTMRRNTDRLLDLINQLLDLSKLDNGAMQLRVTRGDVLQLVRVITGSFDSLAELKRIHYHVYYPETTVLGYFDRDKLEKIITNLLSNAFKYTPEGGAVAIRAEIDNNRFRLSIDDSGPGIARKELDQIFDRFYRVEAVESIGSGLGLALVKELVDLYRGQISVSSEPGRGSRFKISLPIDRASFRAEEMTPDHPIGDSPLFSGFDLADVETPNDTTSADTTLTELPVALVVEDNADLRRFIADCLNEQYRVLTADSGTEGWQSATAAIPDIIVSDVMMPGLTGLQFTEKLKKDERTSHIPVILLTAKAGQQPKLEGLKTGADDYLTKPFDAPELLTRMANLITQRRLLRKKFAGQIILKPSEITIESADDRFLQKVMCSIEQHLGNEDFSVEKLADAVAMSRSQLHRKIQALLDKSPSDLLRQTRLFRAKELLQKRAGVPSEVAYQVGFSSHTYFSKAFRDEFGISPSEV